jgi:AcrR family transcriptional regulator
MPVDSPLTLLAGAPPPAGPADERILQAALEQFALTGIRRTTTDDIAARAGVNRTTLYRRLGAKDQIVRAAMAYEAHRTLARIDAEVAAIPDPVERLLHGFAVTVTTMRGHPLLRHLLLVDRDETLRWATIDAGTILEIATAFVTTRLRILRAELGLPESSHTEGLAAIMVRFIHSLVLAPAGPPALDSEPQLRDFADTHLRPLITTP